MNLALWIIAGVLAFAFAGSGVMKLVQSKDQLVASPTGGWAADWRPASIKLVGVAEILGAIGLILPAALHVAPILVPLAAVQTAERLYLMNCGHNSAKDQARWSPGINVGKPIELSDTCVLIKHGNQWLLWDTGYPDAVDDHPVDTPVGHATRDVHSRTGQKCDSQEVALNRKSVSQHLRF